MGRDPLPRLAPGSAALPAADASLPHCRTPFYYFLADLDWRALEQARRGWIERAARHAGLALDQEAVALDGKEVRGVRKQSQEVLVLVSDFTHQSGLPVALRACGEGQEIAAVQTLLTERALSGRVVTLEALHTPPRTAAQIVEAGGDYVLTVKGNQPGLRARVQAVFGLGARRDHPERDWQEVEQYGRGHGRRECRRLLAVSLSAAEKKEMDWPAAAQVFCLTRSVQRRGPGGRSRGATARAAHPKPNPGSKHSFAVV